MIDEDFVNGAVSLFAVCGSGPLSVMLAWMWSWSPSGPANVLSRPCWPNGSRTPRRTWPGLPPRHRSVPVRHGAWWRHLVAGSGGRTSEYLFVLGGTCQSGERFGRWRV